MVPARGKLPASPGHPVPVRPGRACLVAHGTRQNKKRTGPVGGGRRRAPQNYGTTHDALVRCPSTITKQSMRWPNAPSGHQPPIPRRAGLAFASRDDRPKPALSAPLTDRIGMVPTRGKPQGSPGHPPRGTRAGACPVAHGTGQKQKPARGRRSKTGAGLHEERPCAIARQPHGGGVEHTSQKMTQSRD
jgi:hypothetical protein